MDVFSLLNTTMPARQILNASPSTLLHRSQPDHPPRPIPIDCHRSIPPFFDRSLSNILDSFLLHPSIDYLRTDVLSLSNTSMGVRGHSPISVHRASSTHTIPPLLDPSSSTVIGPSHLHPSIDYYRTDVRSVNTTTGVCGCSGRRPLPLQHDNDTRPARPRQRLPFDSPRPLPSRPASSTHHCRPTSTGPFYI